MKYVYLNKNGEPSKWEDVDNRDFYYIEYNDNFTEGKFIYDSGCSVNISSDSHIHSYVQGLIDNNRWLSYNAPIEFHKQGAENMTKRKHHDVIVAWANGAEVEYRRYGASCWQAIEVPTFIPECEYRVKQARKPVIVRYGVFEFKSKDVYGDNSCTCIVPQNGADYMRNLYDRRTLECNIKFTFEDKDGEYELSKVELIK